MMVKVKFDKKGNMIVAVQHTADSKLTEPSIQVNIEIMDTLLCHFNASAVCTIRYIIRYGSRLTCDTLIRYS